MLSGGWLYPQVSHKFPILQENSSLDAVLIIPKISFCSGVGAEEAIPLPVFTVSDLMISSVLYRHFYWVHLQFSCVLRKLFLPFQKSPLKLFFGMIRCNVWILTNYHILVFLPFVQNLLKLRFWKDGIFGSYWSWCKRFIIALIQWHSVSERG